MYGWLSGGRGRSGRVGVRQAAGSAVVCRVAVAERLSTGPGGLALVASQRSRAVWYSRAPALLLGDGAHDDVDVVGVVGGHVLPHEPASAVVGEHVGGPAVPIRGRDPGGFEDLADDLGPVRLVLGEGLAGPVPADLDAAAAEAEVLPVVRLARAHAGREAGAGVLGLDAEAQPVRTGLRTGQVQDLFVEPVDVRLVRLIGVVRVGVGLGDGFGEVLGQVPDGPVRVLRGCDDALDVDLGAEPDHVRGSGVGVVELREGLVPGLQREPGVRVAVALGVRVPHRGAVHVDGSFVGWPPQRVVGGLARPGAGSSGGWHRAGRCGSAVRAGAAPRSRRSTAP